MYKHFFKRFWDFWIALIAIICLSPLFAVVTIWLLFANKGAGAFYFQERPGRNEKVFKVIKFKSMTDERDAAGNLLPDKDRITKVGLFIRSTSIDELPQLFNILKGDMSFIGPRPLLIRYLPFYNENEKHRHDVRPGITGWAQVNGRNHVNWDDKLAMDVYYVDHLTILFDINICFMTIAKVLSRKDVSAVNCETPFDKYRQNNK